MKIYSQVYNVNRFGLAGVSHQTGQYTHSIPITSLSSLDASPDGVQRDISLSYSLNAAASSDSPYGSGWNLGGITTYIPGQTITLSNGSSFSDLGFDEQEHVYFQDQKFLDFYLKKESDDTYIVCFKDGVSEVLQKVAFNQYMTAQMCFPNGDTYTFQYNSFYGDLYLASISDSTEKTILKLNYSSNTLQQVSVWRGNGEAHAYFTVQRSGGSTRLTMASRFAQDDDATPPFIEFTYRDVTGFMFITDVKYPSGATEEIVPDGTGHRYDDSKGIKQMPRTALFVSKALPTAEPIVETFAYPGEGEGYTNFLGYPNSFNWSSNVDNMYAWGKPSSYFYWVEVTTGTVEESKFVKRVEYNTFHLETKNVITRDNVTIETSYEYPCDRVENAGKTFAEQPRSLQSPVKTFKRFSDGKNETSYETLKETDDFGNEVKCIFPSGITHYSEYYPPTGEADDCPSDPFCFFKRFVKLSRKVAPDNGMHKQKLYKYVALSPVTSSSFGPSSVVKMREIELSDSSNSKATADLSYLDKPDCVFSHNSMKAAGLVFEKDGQLSPRSSCERTIGVSVDNDSDQTITISTKVIGDDGSSRSTTKTQRCYSDLIIRAEEDNGVASISTYAMNGDILSTTSNAETQYEETTTYEHSFLNNETDTPTVTVTETSGRKTRLCYDGAENVVSGARKENDESNYMTYFSQTFDDLGREKRQEHTDYSNEGEKLFHIFTENHYDCWGQLAEERTNQGMVELFTNNPFERKVTNQKVVRDDEGNVLHRLAAVATTYNFSRMPTRIDKIRTSGEVSTTYIDYDGLGRPLQASGTAKLIEIKQYDILDRITEVINPDGSTMRIDFANFSPEELITSVTVSSPDGNVGVIGTQEFDGIGRLKKKEIGGFATKYTYKNSNSSPSMITTPGGDTTEMTFDSVMDQVPERISSWRGPKTSIENAETSTKFSFGTNPEDIGNLTSAVNENTSYFLHYTRGGNIASLEQQVSSGKLAKTSFPRISTLGNHLASSFGVGDNVVDADTHSSNIHYEYNDIGNISRMRRDDMEVVLFYDPFGRVVEETIEDPNGAVRQTTKMAYSDMNEEISRSIQIFSNGLSCEYRYDYTYDDGQKISSRKLSVDGTLKLHEQFFYDSSNRMTTYEIGDGYDPAFLPDAGTVGISMLKQEYVFDMYNNVKQVATTSVGGEKDIATWNYAPDSRKPDSITHTLLSAFPEKVCFSYDEDGNMVGIESTEETISLSYSVSGRLTKYEDSNGNKMEYKYDPFQRIQSDGTYSKYYMSNDVVFEESHEKDVSDVEYIRFTDHVIAEKSGGKVNYCGLDVAKTTVVSHNETDHGHNRYGPYGTGSPRTRTGYNGEIRERKAPIYLLGGGTRVYLPRYQMFTSMDTFSPFSAGGIHPYMYCGGNPINFSDPTGRGLFLNLLSFVIDAVVLAVAIASVPVTGGASIPVVIGATMGLVSSGLGVAASSLEIYDSNHGTDHSKLIHSLGAWSTGLGLASLALDFTPSVSQGAKMTKSAGSRVKNLVKSKGAFKNTEKAVGQVKSYDEAAFQTAVFKRSKFHGKYLKEGQKADKLGGKTKLGKKIIESTTTLDVDAVKKAWKLTNQSKKVVKIGYAGMQLVGRGIGYQDLANGTYSPYVDDAPERPDPDNGMIPDILNMVEQKYQFA